MLIWIAVEWGEKGSRNRVAGDARVYAAASRPGETKGWEADRPMCCFS